MPKNAKQITIAIVDWLPHIRGILAWQTEIYRAEEVGIPTAFIRAICYMPMFLVGMYMLAFENRHGRWRPIENVQMNKDFLIVTLFILFFIIFFHWLGYWTNPGSKLAFAHIIGACWIPFATGFLLHAYTRALIIVLKK